MGCNILKAKLQGLDKDLTAKIENATNIMYNTDHAQLKNLDYEHSGHTGFASSSELQEGLDTKQDKGNYVTQDESQQLKLEAVEQAKSYTDEVAETKVDKEPNKGLSSNDFTNELKNELEANTLARHTHTNKQILDSTSAAFTEEIKSDFDSHIANTDNPHNVTKEQLNLSAIDNTSDLDKPVSTAQRAAIDNSLVEAKSYTDTKLSELNFVTEDSLNLRLSEKVDKEDGKGLSSNDFTNEYKSNLELNTSSRHNHTNKDILDNTTASFTLKLSDKISQNSTDIVSHVNNTNNPHSVTKDQVGLNNVDNTRDIDKPVSTSQNAAISAALSEAKSYTDTQLESKDFISKDLFDSQMLLKVDKEAGKSLSENDFTNELKTNLEQNTSARHSHDNKSILDAVTEPFTVELKSKIDLVSKSSQSHINDKQNPHAVTKNQIGLGNVDNTSDLNKPVSTAQSQAIAESLASAKSYSDSLVANLDFVTEENLTSKLNLKVDKEDGKGLSENDFTNTDKNNLDLNTSERHNHSNKDILDEITAAFTAELKNEFELKYSKPLDGIPESDLSADVISKLNAGTSSGSIDIIKVNNKPLLVEDNTVNIDLTKYGKKVVLNLSEDFNTLTSQLYNTDSDVEELLSESSANINLGKFVTNGSFISDSKTLRLTLKNNQQIDINLEDLVADLASQSSLDSHIQNTSNPHNVTAAQINAEPAFTKNTAFNKNFGTEDGTVCEGNDIRLSNARPASDVSNWAKQPTKPTYTKAEVGLENVDNTSDADKPVSTAQAQAIADAKSTGTSAASIANGHIADKNNPHLVTKEQIGLSNVDNVRQYSAQNPPPYPVTSVDGRTGEINLSDLYVPKTFLQSYYWQKTDALSASLVTGKPDINTSNYLEITTTNTTFDFSNQNKITISKVLENNINISNQQGITSTISFAFSRNASVEFAGRVLIDDVVIGSEQAFAYIQYNGGNTYAVPNELIFTLKFNQLNEVTTFNSGQTLKIELFTRQNNAQNLTTRYYCGVSSQGTSRYCLSGLNLQGVEISTNQIADNSITLIKLNNDVKSEFATKAELSEKQPAGNYATVDQLSNYATNDNLVAGLAEKQPVGDYPLRSELDIYVTDSELSTALDQKQPVGDYVESSDLANYVTNSQLVAELEGKQPVGDYATVDDLETKQDKGNYVTTDTEQSISAKKSVSDLDVNGTLNIYGDIIQNGSSYKTHAEEVYSKKDYIILREGAISALSGFSGFKIIKYDGTNTGILAIDNTGIIRVGDEGDEQAVATREDTPIDNGFAKWDDASKKFITTTDVVNNSQLAEKYSKPVSGIPESDLSADVQSKLNASGGSVTKDQIAATLGLTTPQLDNLIEIAKISSVTDIDGVKCITAPGFNEV